MHKLKKIVKASAASFLKTTSRIFHRFYLGDEDLEFLGNSVIRAAHGGIFPLYKRNCIQYDIVYTFLAVVVALPRKGRKHFPLFGTYGAAERQAPRPDG